MFVGAASAAFFSVDISSLAPAAGDILLFMGRNTGSADAPGTPTGFTSLATSTVDNFSDSGGRIAYKVAAGTETTISSSGAEEVLVMVYRNAKGSPVGASDIAGVYSPAVSWQSIAQTAAPSWVVCMGFGSGAAPVAGYVERHNANGFIAFDSNGDVSSFSPSGSVTSTHAYAASIELSLASSSGALFWAFP